MPQRAGVPAVRQSSHLLPIFRIIQPKWQGRCAVRRTRVSCDVTLRMHERRPHHMVGDHRQDQPRTACMSEDAAVTHSAQRPPVAVQLLICPGTAPTVAA